MSNTTDTEDPLSGLPNQGHSAYDYDVYDEDYDPEETIETHKALRTQLDKAELKAQECLEHLTDRPLSIDQFNSYWRNYVCSMATVERYSAQLEHLLEEVVPNHLMHKWLEQKNRRELMRLPAFYRSEHRRKHAQDFMDQKKAIMKQANEFVRRWTKRRDRCDPNFRPGQLILLHRPAQEGPHQRAFDNVDTAKDIVRELRNYSLRMSRLLKD